LNIEYPYTVFKSERTHAKNILIVRRFNVIFFPMSDRNRQYINSYKLDDNKTENTCSNIEVKAINKE